MSRNASATPLLDASLLHAPVVPRGEYRYFVHPLTDGIPAIEPALLDEVGAALETAMGARPDRLVTAEAMGIPAALALSRRTGIPVTIARKRAYGLPGEVAVPARTGYGSSTLYINGLGPGLRVTIVDDVVSTGGTLFSLIDGLRSTGAELLEVLVVLARGSGLAAVGAKAGVPVRVVRHIEVDAATNTVRLVEPRTSPHV